MIITNPYRHHPTTHEESHLLKDDFGLIGVEIDDCITPTRRWVIQGLYCPIEGRALGGIRAKVVDDFGFISFVNQRDLEVLLLYAQPGQHCIWAGEDYPAPGDR